MPAARRRIVVILVVLAVLATGVTVGVKALLHHGIPPIFASCQVLDGTNSWLVDPDQARNATTIAGVGRQRGLPNHAVTIALAVALQESKLHNIDYGDRDSVGLFQQRESQGWGTKTQIMDPVYSANAFYSHLTKVRGWQTLPVTVAAQRVQHSGAPTAYARHEDLARALAKAFTGESPAAFTCQFPHSDVATPRSGLQTAMTRELGSSAALDRTSPPSQGWLTASWLIAHAPAYGISQVSYAGQTWAASKQAWQPDPHVGQAVTLRLSPPKQSRS